LKGERVEGDMSWKYGLLVLFTVLALGPSHATDISAGAPSDMKRSEPAVLWSRSLAVGASSPSRITIEGAEVDGRFVPQAVSILNEKPENTAKTSLPLGENLLDRLEHRPFGGEERVEAVRSAGDLTIRCGEGNAPAGVVLGTDTFHFPRAARLKLVAKGVGSGEPLGLSVVGRGGDAPMPWQALIGADGVSLQLPPNSADDQRSRDVVINCPPGQGAFRLTSVSLEPDLPGSQPSRTGTWLWEAETWERQPGQIEDWAVASRLDRIFLQLRIDNGEVADRTALADFIGRLGKRGISVHAVEGDPAMVTAEGLSHALRRVAAIRRYQRSSPPDARLGGLQFDIEPYLLADFALKPAAVWSHWAAAVQALSSAWREPISVVVPFWMLDSEGGAAAVATARQAISDVTVMAYRTEVAEVTALSEPWLAWGTVNDVPVRVAIENGPLGVELHRTFVRAETGSLLLEMEGRTGIVSLLSEPVAARRDALAYEFDHETRINPTRISFMNNLSKLAVARAELTRLLVAWPSFDGLMIHALDETDRGVGGARIPTPEARAHEPQASYPDL